MTDQIAYQEYIQRRYNAFCKTVIRCAALDKILKLKRQWERQVSLDYLMNEKFVQFAASEPDEEYPFTVCGQTVLLCNAALADAISVLPEQTREEILRYYFLRQPQRRKIHPVLCRRVPPFAERGADCRLFRGDLEAFPQVGRHPDSPDAERQRSAGKSRSIEHFRELGLCVYAQSGQRRPTDSRKAAQHLAPSAFLCDPLRRR